MEIDLPEGWRVSTSLEGKGDRFRASDYDLFADSPLEMGTQKEYTFTVKGVPHVLAVFGDPAFNPDSLTRDMAKVCSTVADHWGDVPYDRYVFLLHAAPWAGGGTEHANSTIIGARPERATAGSWSSSPTNTTMRGT